VVALEPTFKPCLKGGHKTYALLWLLLPAVQCCAGWLVKELELVGQCLLSMGSTVTACAGPSISRNPNMREIVDEDKPLDA